MDKSITFSENPAEQAVEFEEQGASWIHMVDLNGAFQGQPEPVNMDAVEAVLRRVNIPVQLGGGIRDMNRIDAWMRAGISRVVLGTAAANNPELVRHTCVEYPGKIAVGIDARDGLVAVEGWARKTTMPVVELALKFEDVGVAAIIYTNVNLDGMMQGPDIGGIEALASRISTPVIASGGISSIEDLRALDSIKACGIDGAIVGRAIYDRKLDIRQALKFMK